MKDVSEKNYNTIFFYLTSSMSDTQKYQVIQFTKNYSVLEHVDHKCSGDVLNSIFQ